MTIFKKIIRSIQKILRSAPSKSRKKKKAVSIKRSSRKRITSKRIPRLKKKQKAVHKKLSKAAPKPSKSAEVMVGEVTHFFPKIVVCVVKMNHGTLSVGDQVRIGGKSKDFIQKVNSIQIESVDVKTAKKGQLIGLKVNREVNVGDKLYRLP